MARSEARATSFTLTDADNAPAILFRQAALPERRDRPRLMIPRDSGWEPVSWSELSRRVQRLASFLLDRGVDHERKAVVLSSTRLEWCVAGMAVLAARGVLVPVHPALSGEQLGQVLEHSDARVLLVENAELLEGLLAVLPEPALHTIVCFEPFDLEELCRKAGRGCDGVFAEQVFTIAQAEAIGAAGLERDACRIVERTARIRLDDTGYLLYASSDSGSPQIRGVPLTHRNVGVNGAAWIEVNGPLCHDGDRDLLWLPMSHLFGWGEFCLGNQLGFLSYLSHPSRVHEDLAEVRPHIFMGVPGVWEQLAERALDSAPDEPARIAELRRLTGGRLYFCLSGGGLRREVKELFLRAGMLLCEGYGRTECGPTLTMNRYNDFDFSSVGKPISGVELRIAEDGEILARGANVFSGYYKDPDTTRAVIDAEGWFHTGDRGRWSERGFLELL